MLKLMKNKEIDRFLQSKEIISILESVLEEEINIYNKLDRLYEKGKLDFGQFVKNTEQAYDLFYQAQKHFSKLFGIKIDKDPKIQLLNKKVKGLARSKEAYLNGVITIVSDKELRLKTTLIHGYIHFIIEYIYGYLDENYACFEEGLARVLSEEMAAYFADLENNPSYLYDLVEDALSDLWESYCWLGNVLKIKKNRDISQNYPFKSTYQEKHGKKPDEYARGNSYFKIQKKMNPDFNVAIFLMK